MKSNSSQFVNISSCVKAMVYSFSCVLMLLGMLVLHSFIVNNY